MKRVLVLNQFALPRDQGGGTRHVDLFSRIPGWTARIVAGNRNHYTQDTFVTDDPCFLLVPVPEQNGGVVARLRSWLMYCIGAARAGLAVRADVVYASSPHLLTPLAGWAVARLTRAAYVVEVRDLWPESAVAAGLLSRNGVMHRLLNAVERFMVRRADEIVVVATGWEEHFTALGADMAHYTVVPNGTEPYKQELTEDERDSIKAELDLTGPTAVFAGAHGPKDGIDLILEAAKGLPLVQFALIGDGPAKEIAAERVEREHIANVRMLDPVSKEELPRILGACDVGIHAVSPLPVFQLGMSPNKLFDYLAAGLPVVSNGGSAISGLIGDNTCGHVGGVDSLTVGIATVLDAAPEQRDRWRRTSRSLIVERFSRRDAAERLGAVLTQATRKETP